jgi:hypothetical protein
MRILRISKSALTPGKKTQTKSTIKFGGDGNHTATKEESLMTPTSLTYAIMTKSFSFDLSSASTDKLPGMKKENLPETVNTQWSQALCKMPQAIWLWRFGNIIGPAPCTSRAVTTCSQASEPYSRRTPMSTKLQGDKKPSPPSNCCKKCLNPVEPARWSSVTQPQPLPPTSLSAPSSLPSEVANTQPPPNPERPKSSY